MFDGHNLPGLSDQGTFYSPFKEAGLSDGLRQTSIKAGAMVFFGYPKWIKLGPYIHWYMESIWGLLGSMSIRPFCHKWP